MLVQFSSPPAVQAGSPNIVAQCRQICRQMGLRMVRPSVLDIRFTGDPWVVDRNDGTFTICLGDTCLAGVRGVTFDLPSFNQVLDRIRSRGRRWQSRCG
jgi:hypothetical protein